MAAAACSHGSHRFPGLRHSAVRGDQQQHQPPPQQQQQTPQQQQQQQSVRKRSDSRRRQAALHFLSNISLDGRLPLDVTNGFAELEPLDEATAPARLGSLSCISAIQSGALVTQTPRFGPGAGATYGGGSGGPVFTFPRDTSLCGQTQAPGTAEGNSEAPAAGTPGGAAAGSGTPLLKSAAQGLLSPAQAASPFGLDLQKQRSRTSSGSPHPKNTKKVHFIKNMRQYDTRNSRIVLICAKRSLCSAFSILPYGEFINNSDNKLDGQRQRNPSGGGGSSTDMILGLEGVELGADGKDCVRPRISINEEGLKVEPLKSVSYAQFLYPTNAFVTQRSILEASGPCQPARTSVHRNVASGRISNATVAMELGSEFGDLIEYDPNLLDDPQWPCGKHKRVLIFASYMTTVIEYVKPSDLKKDMNETFKEKFPHIKLTLSKIRSLKREMRNLAEECNLEPCTVALSFVYFEKLVLQGKVNKQNRKLCSGACLLLAAKISSDLKKYEVKHLIDKLEERLRLNSKELVSFEFAALVALEFGLYLPGKKVFPHYRRLVQQS